MCNNYNYSGADDGNAPEKVSKQEFQVTLSQSISKTVEVTTDDYTVAREISPDTGFYEEYADTTDTDWYNAYIDSGHFTPLQLISIFKKYLEYLLTKKGVVSLSPRYLKKLIRECDGWQEENIDVMEE